jgi:hypothetical protein
MRFSLSLLPAGCRVSSPESVCPAVLTDVVSLRVLANSISFFDPIVPGTSSSVLVILGPSTVGDYQVVLTVFM